MIHINPGILTNLILVILLILIWSGWFQSFIKELGTERSISLFLVLTFVFLFLDVQITSNWKINIGGFLFPLIGYLVILFKEYKKERLHLLIATILLGASFFLFKELIRLDPILLVMDEVYQITLLLSVMIIIVASKLSHRIILLLGGILLGDFLFQLRHEKTLSYIYLGGSNISDILWMAVIFLIVLHSIFIGVTERVKEKKMKIMKIR